MSTHILLRSLERNRLLWPNPAEFTVTSDQTAGWSSLTRDTVCVKACGRNQVCNLLYCIKLIRLLLPNIARNSNNATLPENEPFIYVRFSSTQYNDTQLVNTMNSVLNDITFVCEFERNQGTGNEWMQYRSNQNQCIRFDPYKPEIFFRVFTNQGGVNQPVGGLLNILANVDVATAAALPASNYAHPAQTLTAAVAGFLVVDGVAMNTVGTRILVKNQAVNTENGIYTVTTVGDAVTQWVLTRAADFNQAQATAGNLVGTTTIVPVIGGNTNKDTSWSLDNTLATISPLTDAVTFTQFFLSANNSVRIVDALPPNIPTAANQVMALFEFTPYIREGEYDNQTVETWYAT